MMGILSSSSFAAASTCLCSSVNPSNPFMTFRLSCICSLLLMPDRTVSTPSRSAQNRRAQDAQELSGSAASNTALTDSGGSASMPPFTGSMMITGFPCFLATS